MRELLHEVLPKSWGKPFYSVPLWTLKTAMKAAGGPEVWARHSYALGTLEPPLSDLDLTFYYSAEPTREVIGRIFTAFEKLKRVYPLFGELNTYVENDLGYYWRFANPLELERDPHLLARAKLPVRDPSETDKFVFLLRMLESDYANINRFGNKRRTKWQRHADDTGLDLPDFLSVASLCRAIGHYFNGFTTAEKETAALLLKNYWTARLARSLVHEFWEISLFQCLYPYRIGFDYRLNAISFENPVFAEIAESQLEWEIWGLYTQFRHIALRHKTGWPFFADHFAFLKEFTNIALPKYRAPERLSALTAAMDRQVAAYHNLTQADDPSPAD